MRALLQHNSNNAREEKTVATEKWVFKTARQLRHDGIINFSVLNRMSPMGARVHKLHGLAKLHRHGVRI